MAARFNVLFSFWITTIIRLYYTFWETSEQMALGLTRWLGGGEREAEEEIRLVEPEGKKVKRRRRKEDAQGERVD